MSKQKIKVEIECTNIAPLVTLKEKLNTGSLKYGVFASNGSGKTFMSRMFRLTEKTEEHEIDDAGKSTTDRLITRGKTKGSFKFKITDTSGEIKEDISIDIEKGRIPLIPDTKYIYHTFNQDYVEKNIRTLNFDKDSDVQGYILGKINIDLNTEEAELAKLKEENIQLTKQIESDISTYVREKIRPIRDINRINEFKNLEAVKIYQNIDSPPLTVSKSMELLLDDYNNRHIIKTLRN